MVYCIASCFNMLSEDWFRYDLYMVKDIFSSVGQLP